ncbi:MAG: 23S rRNA (guanosine(2251)-2'-O)-methyltransferase RlmB [Flavobacteriales bacterium]|nr:MAG: 23S rRNA (guanosine(2251)-2'-O)-methyltransferase RlmB [Flavobacteriales bacterium]
MIYGIHAVTEAIRAGKEIDKLFLQEGLKSDLSAELRRITKENDVLYVMVPGAKLDRIAAGKNHQGCVAFISSITYFQIEELLPTIFEAGRTPLLLILDRITDVRNFGAIARSAECAGVDAIIIPSRGAAQVGADAIKTSAGALHAIPICRESNLKDTIDFLKASGLRIASCTEKGSTPHHKTELSGPLAIVMGSEEDGISSEYLKRSDVRVQIPMRGKISSLNVSVATGIILFEVLRQRELSED